jgi:Raf kinase inhibitor-like YbhB/YbcL family protein
VEASLRHVSRRRAAIAVFAGIALLVGGTIGAVAASHSFGYQRIRSGLPSGLPELTVTSTDLRAHRPIPQGFWHWVAWDIPPETTSLPTNAVLPAGSVNGENDNGTPGYTGPCPLAGDKTHHYEITVVALSVPSLGLDETTHGAVVGFNIGQNALASGQLVATAQQ